jgi:2-keto-myo-inositol isomerase
LIPCISQATTLSTPFDADLASYAAAGFETVELWLTKLEAFLEGGRTIVEVRSLLDANGLRAAAASQQGGLLLSTGADREAHWSHFRRRLEWLGELQVPTLVLVADFVSEATLDDYARAAASLGEAAELAAQFQVRLALEFNKRSGLCASLETAAAIVAETPGDVGICLDLFHYYTGPSKFEDLAHLSPANLAWVQLSDLSSTPREIAGDADRILPGDGDFQTGAVLDQLEAIGYDGVVSLEVLNPSFWAIPPERVADVAMQSLLRVLGPRAGSRAPGDS